MKNTLHSSHVKGLILASVAFLGVNTIFSNAVLAEDCTGTLPAGDCTLDEDTTAPLTIDSGVTLTIGNTVSIDHTIDGDDAAGDGDIDTTGGGNVITQNADIGSIRAIDSLTIADDNVWNNSAAIITNNDGSDINLGAADGGETLNFLSGSSYNGEIDGHTGDTLNFGSDGNGGTFSSGGQIETVSVILTSGSLTVTNTVGGGTGLGALTINDGATLNMSSNVTTDGALDLDGTVNISAGSRLSANTYTADADEGTFKIQVNREASTTETGQLAVAAGGPLDLTNDTIQIVIDSQSQILQNETIANIVSGNGGATLGPGTFIDSSFLYDFDLQANGNNFDLVITRSAIPDSTDNTNNAAVARVLIEQLAESESVDINQIQTLLGSAPDRSTFNERLESLLPTADGGYARTAINIIDTAEDSIHARLHVPAVEKGYNAGDIPKSSTKTVLVSGRKNLDTGRNENRRTRKLPSDGKLRVWTNGFGQSSSQDDKDSVNGYDATTAGYVIGVDTGDKREDLILGATFVQAHSEIDSENANSTLTETNSYGGSIYAGKYFDKSIILSGSVSYLYNNNDTRRYNVGGVSNNTLGAEFVSENIALKSTIGKEFDTKHSVSFFPYASIEYDFVSADEYVERNTNDASLRVDYDAIHRVQTGIGVDMAANHVTDSSVILRPSGHLSYKYSILNNATDGNAILNGQIFGFDAIEPSKHVIDAGAGVDVILDEQWMISAKYDLNLDRSQISQTGKVNLAYGF